MVLKLDYTRNLEVEAENVLTDKIYELVFANGTSRDDENAREDHR